MGLYIRKSLKVGPLRFNLSKSGVGASVGVEGFRVGTGPKGNYIHMGMGGVYYRKSLNDNKDANNINIIAPEDKQNGMITHNHSTYEPLKDIDSANIYMMQDSSSKELLDELNGKRKKIRFWPIILISGFFVSYLSPFDVGITIAITALATFMGVYFDKIRKNAVLLYDFDEEAEKIFEVMQQSFEEMKSSKKTWHIEAEGKVTNGKYHAGASSLVKRKAAPLIQSSPPYVKTNIKVPSICAGKQTLFFFPDRVLVFEKNAVGAVSYADLQINSYVGNFIEDESVPNDSNIVGKTWRYVNKKGGPDKRFNNNKELPIVEYQYLDLTSKTGLNERICLSKVGANNNFEKSIDGINQSSK
jgi:hypothetical protein